jgi:hypothetical protein
VGHSFYCINGTFNDLCGGCLPPNVTEEQYLYWMTVGGCGITRIVGGKADHTLNYMLGEVFPAMNLLMETMTGSVLTTDRDRTIVMGYSLGGVFACYAAWTRPEVATFIAVNCVTCTIKPNSLGIWTSGLSVLFVLVAQIF